MSDTGYTQYSIYISLIFFGVYALNLFYMKLVREGMISPIQNLEGISQTEQVMTLLLMSIFYGIFIVHKEKTRSS